MQIDPTTLSAKAQDQLTVSVVIPRPIGWVSTVDANGARNLAPFSFFNAVAGAPPIVMLSIGERNGKPKDTLANILATREFVVNVVSESLAQQMNATSANVSPDVDEFTLAGVASAPSAKVCAPRVADALVSMECKLTQTVELPRGEHTVVFGEVVWFHIADSVLDERGRVDPQKLQPIARLGGGGLYATLGTVFEMKRPP